MSGAEPITTVHLGADGKPEWEETKFGDWGHSIQYLRPLPVSAFAAPMDVEPSQTRRQRRGTRKR